jgi:hypothetical protein
MKIKILTMALGLSLASFSFSANEYVSGTSYQADDEVATSDGSIYKCKGWPYTSWCSGAAWAYAPGEGIYWENAWILVSEGQGNSDDSGDDTDDDNSDTDDDTNDSNSGNSGQLRYHTTFPVTENSTTMEKLDLSESKYTKLILPNVVSGVLLEYMIHETYPNRFENNKDYLVGALFAQLLQENISTKDYPGGEYINTGNKQDSLLNPGQGGPYQLNDYSKRLPDVGINNSKGLINYKVLQGSLGFTIYDQDSGAQTASVGPQSLDNIYFGPIAATYFHYNDLNRIEVNNSTSYGPQPNWDECKTNLINGDFPIDQILNAAYNAGTYSNILLTLVDTCAYANQPGMSTYIADFSNYSMNDGDFINRFQFGDLNTATTDIPTALPGHYSGTTYVLYPRQVRYYVDQLTQNNTHLNQYGLSSDISFSFSHEDLRIAFVESMQTIGDIDETNTYNFISESDATNAFNESTTQHTVKETWDFSNQQDRETVYLVIFDALANLETELDFKFSDTTEKDHVIGEAVSDDGNDNTDPQDDEGTIIENCGEMPTSLSEWEQRAWWDQSIGAPTNYKAGDFVTFQGSIWKAQYPNVNEPTVNPWDWKKCN